MLEGTEAVTAAREGGFEAVFTNGKDAAAFYARLTANPAGDYVDPGSVKLNRKGGRVVTWTSSRQHPDEGSQPGWYVYWRDMAETVGYYGSTFGEPPYGAGKRTAYLNGMPGTASM